jgi:hypothetical protein
MEIVHIRAKEFPENVIRSDKTNADILVATGDWEYFTEDEPEAQEPEAQEPEVKETEKEEVSGDDSSKPAGRRRAPRSTATS